MNATSSYTTETSTQIRQKRRVEKLKQGKEKRRRDFIRASVLIGVVVVAIIICNMFSNQ